MFLDKTLNNHLQTSTVVKSQSLVVAEWNMNSLDNIDFIGNYRNRPLDSQDSIYKSAANIFDRTDEGNFYTDATYSDIVIDGGYDDDNEPIAFKSMIEKEKSLYSLEECFGKFRPRSGINKLRYFDNNFSHHTNSFMAQRPRYYMSDKYDSFKYWTSYRSEDGLERGIAKNTYNGQFFIDDAAPFVVYKEEIPANRLVVKMQTNVGNVDLGNFSNSFTSFSDPFFGYQNQTTPVTWKIQVLKNQSWIDAKSFNPASIRKNGENIIGADGYLELFYGLIVPEPYRDIFKEISTLSSQTLLPSSAKNGDAYLISSGDSDIGTYYIWINSGYQTFTPSYGWDVYEDSDEKTGMVSRLVNPKSYLDAGSGELVYREIDLISGIRLVVTTMNKFDSTLDIIEMSPRLTANISEMTLEYSVNKQASDLGISGMPVGQLLASTGSITIFDDDQAFNENNTNSLIAKHLDKNIQFKFFEVVLDVEGLYNYSVPIKTLYSEASPEIDLSTKTVAIELRDMFFYFESLSSPQIFIQNASVSYAVSLLLDSIGFSNYSFKRIDGESESVIPDFFVGPDMSIAQVLQDIAVSTQTAMFFDEYNNFIMMSKKYMMPSDEERPTDLSLYGNDLVVDLEDNVYVYSGHVTGLERLPNESVSGVYTVGQQKDLYSWSQTAGSWENIGEYKELKTNSNIIDVSFQKNHVYNDGKIVYTTRYIQRSYGSIRQAYLVDQDKTWIYKPALLWEVTGENASKSVNGEVASQSSYVLGAIPLNSTLSNQIPEVRNHEVVNNTIDFGEGIYWNTRYNGYFYSNGEVIKFDAVQYNIPKSILGSTGNQQIDNNIWITSSAEYESYFSKLSFNGKIYPTGLVRIYSEPNYETVNGVTRLKNGPVAKHGRGQFNTAVTDHQAGLSDYWSSKDNRRGCKMDSSYLFNDVDIPATNVEAAGVDDSIASKTTCNGVIRNFLSSSYISESDINNLRSTSTGTVQSSALIMNGPAFTTTQKPLDYISYIHKPLDSHYRHFGTRMRIIGKIENGKEKSQTAIGATTYYSSTETSTSSTINVSGSSGGLAVMLNPKTNVGYYFEIAALTDLGATQTSQENKNYNIMFYKLKKKSDADVAIPIKLWAGLTQIVADDGTFTGQSRIVGEEVTTVYDLAVEYENFGSSRKFYLYLNNNIVAIVTDDDPLPIYNNMALFIRGSARCMFENIYALTNNYSKDSSYILDTPINSIFGNSEISVNDSFRKYSMSGMVQSTYLSGLSSSQPPAYNMYFEEFGTIMREASYFNVRYDKAYPALYAKLSPTFNNVKGYVVSGFIAGAYGAEFLVFNTTDTALSLDESSGNYLRIQGVTFTQQSPNELSVDDYFSKKSDVSDPEVVGSNLIYSPLVADKSYKDIKYSRSTYGKKEFVLTAPYIQSMDDANSMMSWISSKIMKPRKSVGLKVFSMPTVQLGDIVSLSYFDKDGFSEISSEQTRFVVYSIEYSKTSTGPEMNIFLSEVV